MTAVLFAGCISVASCEALQDADATKGEIRICFRDDFHCKGSQFDAVRGSAAASIPDTNNFILHVYGAAGNILYQGRYGEAPESIVADPGTYTVEIESCEFSEPLFDSPQYGDTQVITVGAGQSVGVVMECSQLNSGIRLNINSDFLTAYPSGILEIKSAEGRLIYGYSEKRIGYFKPGKVSLVIYDNGSETTLFTRNLLARDILSVNVSAGVSEESKAGIRVSVDTCRNWISENYTIGGEEGGSDTDNAFSVGEAKNKAGTNDVWVYGYIVGGDLSSSRCSFDPPFTSNTNLVIASKSSCRNKESCLSVQLQKGAVRDALNLVTHPENIGKQVFLKGDIVDSYFGIPGIQCVSEYKWK